MFDCDQAQINSEVLDSPGKGKVLIIGDSLPGRTADKHDPVHLMNFLPHTVQFNLHNLLQWTFKTSA
jgi:hypothetical protein